MVLAGFLLPRASARAGVLADIWRILSGGEDSYRETSVAAISTPLMGSQSSQNMPVYGIGGSSDDPGLPLASSQDSALVAQRNPAGTLPTETSDQIVIYTVAEGDTPSSIAAKFGISLNTLLWTNNIKNARAIKIGDELVVLPVSGVQYEIKKGDTIESIARKFKPKNMSAEDFSDFLNEISNYNSLAINKTLRAGNILIIPDGEMSTAPTPSAKPAKGSRPSSGLPEYIGYYRRPIDGGRKTQGIHGNNGVDLANSCGTPMRASASGRVIVAKSSGWNTGYGKYIVITHPNNTQTLYGHMQAVYVTAGRVVEQGEIIGELGTTGRSTGCHIHFEIRGAKNSF